MVRLGVLLAVGLATFQVLPTDAKTRLTTLFSLGSDYNTNLKEEGRIAIWERNLVQARKRPWGFGAGTFDAVDGRASGKYRAAHNTFLETLVELGVLGLALFLSAWRHTLRALADVLTIGKDGQELSETQMEQRVFARALRMSLMAALLCCFFLSMTYMPMIWLLHALATCIYLCSRRIQTAAAGRVPIRARQ